MRVRVVDFRRHSGGGRRFFVQLTKALQESGQLTGLEVVSHGQTLEETRSAFADYGIEARFTDIPWDRRYGLPTFSGYQVPRSAISDCDIAWFPWLHHHRPPAGIGPRVVASFHDGLMFAEPVLASRFRDEAAHERETVRLWAQSNATLVCSSRYWDEELVRHFGCPPRRFQVVPISGQHSPRTHGALASHAPRVPEGPFVLCAANTSWHKNHEVLFEACARANLGWPLVLTGPGSDLRNPAPLARRALRRIAVSVGLRPPHRAGILRDLAGRLGLVVGKSLFPLGNLDDADYDALLGRAACVVMPTLGEGGGSFPVEEALLRGIPVICSDIPVLREHVQRLGAEVAWFDPRDAASLAGELSRLARDYDGVRRAAQSQVARLRVRTWAEVAADYIDLFRSAVASARAA